MSEVNGEVRRATAAIIRMGPPQTDTAPKGVGGPPKLRSVFSLPRTSDYSTAQISWVIDGLIAEGTVTILTGEPGAGKTTLLTAAGYSVAHGKTFAGLETSRRKVLILDRENSLSVVRERFDRLGIEDDSENLFIWGGWCSEQPPAASSAIVLDFVEQLTPKPLIVIDSLVSNLEGSENDASLIRQHMDGYRLLANLGASVVVLHHVGKSETARDYRGSSDIKGSVDVGLKLTNLGDPSRLGLLQLTAFKSRFATSPGVVLSYANGKFTAGQERTQFSTYDLLVQLLMDNPRIRVVEFEGLAIGKGVGRSKAREFIERGLAAGRIRTEKGAKASRHYVWIGDGNKVSDDLL